jgi:hypothetical protein
MAEYVIELDGVEQCLRDLKTFKYDISKRVVGKALAAGGKEYKAAMVLRAPYGHARYDYPGRKSPVTPYKYNYRGKRSKRIGTTRRAIVVRTYQDQDGPTVLVRVTHGIGALWDAFYAMFVLQGTKRLKPNKWAYQAATNAKPKAMQAVADELKEGCRNLGLEDGD